MIREKYIFFYFESPVENNNCRLPLGHFSFENVRLYIFWNTPEIEKDTL